MPTPFETLYTATKAIMALVNSASSLTVAQAASNYGTDFRIASAAVAYQIQITPLDDYHRGTVSYPRASVTVLLHHYAATLANEETFSHETMSHMADQFLPATKWEAQAGVFSLDPDEEPEIESEGREGNVISFSATAVVLMDAV
jgi:hypothetical protein